jgi:hypothetical protein
METTVKPLASGRKAKQEEPASYLERHIRKYIPSLEDYIVRKTLADKRRSIFGQDPFN